MRLASLNTIGGRIQMKLEGVGDTIARGIITRTKCSVVFVFVPLSRIICRQKESGEKQNTPPDRTIIIESFANICTCANKLAIQLQLRLKRRIQVMNLFFFFTDVLLLIITFLPHDVNLR